MTTIDPGPPGTRSGAGPALELLAVALVVTAAVLPVSQLISRWSARQGLPFGAESDTAVLRSWVANLGLGPAVLLLAALLLVAFAAARPLGVAMRRTLGAITVVGLVLAVAQVLGALDALISAESSGLGMPGEPGSAGVRIGVAASLLAPAIVAGVVAWASFTLVEQQRIASVAFEPAPEPQPAVEVDPRATSPDAPDT